VERILKRNATPESRTLATGLFTFARWRHYVFAGLLRKLTSGTTTLAHLRHKPPDYMSLELYYISAARNSSTRIRQVTEMFGFCVLKSAPLTKPYVFYRVPL